MSRIGLCLGGGGSRGAYQVGVAKALEELGILSRITAFSGTSIGAVNAALLASASPDEALAIWLDVSQDEIRTAESAFRRFMKEGVGILDSGIYTIAPLEHRLRERIDFSRLAGKEVFVTVFRGGEAGKSILGLMKSVYRHYLGKEQNLLYLPLSPESGEEAVNLILASCTIPAVFPGVVSGDRKYYDGGISDNIPVKPLAEAGCDIVIAIHLYGLERIDPERFPGIRLIEIRPSASLGWMLNFDPAKNEKHYRLGYADCMKYFNEHSMDF
jgi:NTE family protein